MDKQDKLEKSLSSKKQSLQLLSNEKLQNKSAKNLTDEAKTLETVSKKHESPKQQDTVSSPEKKSEVKST